MMSRKNKASPQIEQAVGRAVDYEITVADLARRSERRAWVVAGSAVAMSLLLAGGCFVMLPLKEKVPYLVMADAYTGTATVARLRGDFHSHDITKHEAVNRSNVAHFVLARESYDAELLKHRDWITVYTMAAPDVASGYTALNSPRNPDSPLNVYGSRQAIRVRILSIVLHAGTSAKASTGATVRFQRSLYNKAEGTSQPLDSKIATLEFSYKDNLEMDEKHRIENPLGFQVTSYRIDTDYAPAPPAEPEMVPAAAMAAMFAGNPQTSAAPAPAPSAVPAATVPAAAVPADDAAPAAARVPAASTAGAPATPSAAGGRQ